MAGEKIIPKKTEEYQKETKEDKIISTLIAKYGYLQLQKEEAVEKNKEIEEKMTQIRDELKEEISKAKQE